MLRRTLSLSLLLALIAPATRVQAHGFHVTEALANNKHANVIVLGIDGMDPNLLQQFVDKGVMPNFQKLMNEGSFSPLGTSMPPQSPVAWSNFITGLNPGGHGVFDFIHRDPSDYLPEFSSADIAAPEKTLRIGRLVIPLSEGKTDLLRQGEAFWQMLERDQVPYLVFRIPANFPPAESKGVSVAGMGAPDLLGSYGTFSFYTDDPTLMSLEVSGGEIYPVRATSARVEAELIGPPNSMFVDTPTMTRKFTVDLDRENRTARITVGKQVILLAEGEWSDWVVVEFDVLPLNKVTGITRFFMKKIDPYFQLYATPININPAKPALPIDSDGMFSKYLYDKIGYYYTQGMAEDTKAFEWGILSDAEFVDQTEIVLQERLKMMDAILTDYDGGFLFFYFSTVDLSCHMLWRNMDPNHPGHSQSDPALGGRIEELYIKMDDVLGEVRERVPEDATIIVMSDHGFAPFYKKFNVNTWLYENDFLTLRKPKEIGRHPIFRNVFWRRTKAYGMGINGLYVNLRGREGQGTVKQGEEYEALLDEISEKLLAYRDPDTGEAVIKTVYRASEIYDGAAMAKSPDLIIGYYSGYRCSDDSALGSLSKTVLTPNMDRWSGDHCMALDEVPGILVSNRQLMAEDPRLIDLTTTILSLYNIEAPANLKGRALFQTQPASPGPGSR